MHFKWLNTVKSIIHHCGLSYIWYSQSIPNKYWLKNNVIKLLKEQYIQNWHSKIFKYIKNGRYSIVYMYMM